MPGKPEARGEPQRDSESHQHVPGALDGLGDAALLFCGQMGVFAGENLAGVCNVAIHQLGLGEGELFRCKTALSCGSFCGAHFEKGENRNRLGLRLSICIPDFETSKLRAEAAKPLGGCFQKL